MNFNFTSDQHDFAAGLRAMLEREFTAARLRAVWDSGTGHDPELWARLAEMGVLGMMIPETSGGLGGNYLDTVLLLEELGRAAVPGPVIETMTVGAIALADTRWTTGIADGTVSVTAALMGERYVPHGSTSTVVITGESGAVRAAESNSLNQTTVHGIDGGRRLSIIEGIIEHDPIIDVDADALVDAGALAAAAYLLGLSSRMLAIAGDYARDRRQFGQPIGAFQAVKHLMANALLQVEFARPAIYRAAWSYANNSPDRTRDVSMAKALISDATQKAARSALQVHGAIGYTWECDLQLFMKKAWALAPAWGNATLHRRRVADALLGSR